MPVFFSFKAGVGTAVRLPTICEVDMSRPYVTIDGNETEAYIAHKTNEVVAIHPITPAGATEPPNL